MKLGAGRRRKDPAAAPPYLSHFGLREPPFANGDTRFFHADPEREQALNMLLHLAQYSEELLLVAGPEGAGKTKLLEQFLQRADENWKVCRFGRNDTGDAGQLFVYIAQCFGLDVSSAGGDPLDALKNHLEALQTKQVPILVVDDAQALSDDALEMVVRMADLSGEHGKLVRTVLFSEPEVVDRLKTGRFESVPEPHRIDLKPLDESQTAAYIEHRLTAAGFENGQPLTARQLKRIHKESRGWPGGINRKAHEALVERMKQEKPSLLGRGRVIFGGVALALIIAIAAQWGWHHFGGDKAEPAKEAASTPAADTEETDTARLEAAKPIVREGGFDTTAQSLVLRGGEALQVMCAIGDAAAAPRVTPPPAPAQGTTDTAPTATQAPGPVEPPAPPAPAEPEEDRAPVAPEPTEEAPATRTNLELNGVIPDPVIGSNRTQTLTLTGSGFTENTRVIVSWSGRSKLLAEDRVEFADSKRLRIQLNTGMGPTTWAVQVSEKGREPSDPIRFRVVPPPQAGGGEAPAGPAAAPEKAGSPPAVNAVEPSPVPGSWEQQTLTIRGRGFTSDSRVGVAWDGSWKTLPAERTEYVDDETLRVQLTTGTRSDDWRLRVTTPAGASDPFRFRVTGQAAAPAAGSAALRGTDWIRRQPDGRYTVQLVASSDPEGPEAFARRYGLSGDLAAAPLRKRGATLYGLFKGSFDNRARAEAAIAKLPTAVRRQSPWPRPFADVKRELPAEAPAAATPEAPSSGPAAGTVQGEPWLWTQDPSHFTVQLVGASDRGAILAFLDGHRAEGPVAVYATERDGRPWYVLVYGEYTDRAAAERALAELPAPLRRSSPWIRPFAAIHEDLAGLSR